MGLFVGMCIAIFTPHICIPFIQKHVEKLQVPKLNGSYADTPKPNFWLSHWIDGSFQKKYEAYIRDRNEAAPLYIRTKSQIDFSIFNTVFHENIVVGKNNYLYTQTDCDAFIGKNYMGKKWIEEKIRKLKSISDHFAEKNVPFLVLTPPAKSTISPENLPDFYQKYQSDSTNRNVFKDLFIQYDIPFIDFEYLIDMEDTSKYFIYPNAGLHWSKYGLTRAADSLRSYIGKNLSIQMVDMNWQDNIELKKELSNTDNELLTSANLLFYPPLETMAYPIIQYSSDSTTTKPKVLTVGDSFYYFIYLYGIQKGLFAEGSMFWYYYSEIHPERMQNGRRIPAFELDPIQNIEEADLVILMAYEENLDRFGFGFIDKVYETLNNK